MPKRRKPLKVTAMPRPAKTPAIHAGHPTSTHATACGRVITPASHMAKPGERYTCNKCREALEAERERDFQKMSAARVRAEDLAKRAFKAYAWRAGPAAAWEELAELEREAWRDVVRFLDDIASDERVKRAQAAR